MVLCHGGPGLWDYLGDIDEIRRRLGYDRFIAAGS
jgi:hypothetical protein